MYRNAFIALAATVALGIGTSSAADAMYKKRHHHHNHQINFGFGFAAFPLYAYGFGYPRYSILDDHYAYEDCMYRRVAVKKWNKSHTHRYIVYRKRLVCY